VVVPLLTVVALAQTVLLAQVDLLGARPDLMLSVVLVWAVLRGVDEGMVWGLIGGLALDILSGGPMGANTLALLAAALLAGQSWGRGIGSALIRLLLLAFVAILAYHLVLLFVLSWTGYLVDWGWAILRVAGPSALLNMALAPFVQVPLSWLERSMRRERSFVL
jgi:rod shape-determining protein MreD